MNKDDFVIPAFLNKDKSSKVKAINIENDERIKEFMESDCVDSGVDPDEVMLNPDEVIFVEGEDEFINEAMTTPTDELLKDGKWHEIPTMVCKEPIIFKEDPENKISEAQLKDVARMARALRPDEIRTVLDNIPVNYIYDKIGQVLETNRKFNEAIMKATDIIK